MEQLKFGHLNSSIPSGRSTSRGAKVCGIMGVSCCGQLRIFGSHKISDLIRENCSILNTTPLPLRRAKHGPLHLICLWSAVSRASPSKGKRPGMRLRGAGQNETPKYSLRYRCGGFAAGGVVDLGAGFAAGVVPAGAPAFAGYA